MVRNTIEFVVGVGAGLLGGVILTALAFVWIIVRKKNELLMTLAGVKAKHAEKEEKGEPKT